MTWFPWVMAGAGWVVVLGAWVGLRLIRREWHRMNNGWAEVARDAVIHGVRLGVQSAQAGLGEEEAAAMARDQQVLMAAARAADSR